MDSLPNEILENVLKCLPQKFLLIIASTVSKKWHQLIFQPSFYFTIELQSLKHLDKFIAVAKEAFINDKHIGQYVKSIIFDDIYACTNEQILELLTVCPHIQSIISLDRDIGYNRLKKNPINSLPPLQQLVHFSHWFTDINEDWTALFNNNNNNNTKIKVLAFDIDKPIMDASVQQPIHLQRIGQPRLLSNHLKHHASSTVYKNNILFLPSLKNLTNLKIDFDDFAYKVDEEFCHFDEYTFENVFRSCPQLEVLLLSTFYMNISEDYSLIQTDNMFQPAYYLKEFEIDGKLNDPLCFTYLSRKFPYIESFKLYLDAITIPSKTSGPYKLAIHAMMSRLEHLKKFEFGLYDISLGIRLDENTYFEPDSINDTYFPNNEILEWVLQYPTQLTHLTYKNKLFEEPNCAISHLVTGMPDSHIVINYENTIDDILNQRILFFNHLTYLSISAKLSRDIYYNYLLKNENTTILSSSIQELILNESTDGKNELLYIFDWLDALPNLTSLTVKRCKIIMDKSDSNDKDIVKDWYAYAYTNYVHELHDIVKERKLQQQIGSLSLYNNNEIYKLKNLTLHYSEICIKNGFNGVFKHCPHLKRIKLNNINYGLSDWNTNLDTYFDLSFLSLEELYIISINYVPWNSQLKIEPILTTELIVEETLYNKKSAIPIEHASEHSNSSKNHPPVTLRLKCRNVDKIVFNSYKKF
ncbi:hypothetical protein BJ944DRAFT_243061 [Cunninghamella echinulata]|nr:hypothetical protein BJ944DRAFT_243061 [Cunninghamella echinulata]